MVRQLLTDSKRLIYPDGLPVQPDLAMLNAMLPLSPARVTIPLCVKVQNGSSRILRANAIAISPPLVHTAVMEGSSNQTLNPILRFLPQLPRNAKQLLPGVDIALFVAVGKAFHLIQAILQLPQTVVQGRRHIGCP